MIDDVTLVHRLRALPGLRSALLFGSALTPAAQRSGSIADVFALIDDLEATLTDLGVSPLGRRLSRGLAPVTVALEVDGGPGAKLNLATPAAVGAALARLRDLSLAGRLAKKTRLLCWRHEEGRRELLALVDQAAGAMARAATLALPRRTSLPQASRRCFGLSYRAELRPETPAQIEARYDAHAAEYLARDRARLTEAARARGIAVVDDYLVDGRPSAARWREAGALAALLWRGRLRALLRWARAPLFYRGWLAYLVGKLERTRGISDRTPAEDRRS